MIKDNRERLFELMNRVAKMPNNVSYLLMSDENKIINESLDEIDMSQFSDMQYSCMNIDELKNYLNKILNNYSLSSSKRVKSTLLIHNKIIQKKDNDIDVQKFIDDITQLPKQIISTGNAKMIKSSTENSYTITIGLPAFKGIAYNIERKNFIVVHTCPGAGNCVKCCYARKGRYVLLPNIFLKQTRILNLLLNNPEGFKEQLKKEIKNFGSKKELINKRMLFRWNDSGDFFTKKYFDIAREIMKELQDEGFDVKPYAHTKVADIYNSNRLSSDFSGSLKTDAPDFIIAFSVDANKKEFNKVDLTNAKTSEIVPRKYFDDLFLKSNGKYFDVNSKGELIFKDSDGLDELKRRIATEFNVNINSLLSHEELLRTPEADKPIYNVIVHSKGETDLSTQRPDVLRTFFLIH